MNIEIPLIERVINEGSHLVAPIYINGNIGMMVIDTGASATMFDEKRILNYIEGETVKTVGLTGSGIGGVDTVKVAEVYIDKLQLGDLRLYGLKSNAMKLDPINRAYKKLGYTQVEGIIGSDLLRKYKAVIDYDGKKMILSV